jgi:hypothetical protein
MVGSNIQTFEHVQTISNIKATSCLKDNKFLSYVLTNTALESVRGESMSSENRC